MWGRCGCLGGRVEGQRVAMDGGNVGISTRDTPIGFILTIVLLVKYKEKRWSINYEITFGGPI